MDLVNSFVMQSLDFLAALFIFVVGLGALLVVLLFILDANQSRDAIRHNYPVVGRFRDIFIRLGEFFRQYFFALDREEMPFNRAERDWIYKSAKGHDNTAPFGSTRVLSAVGTPIFVNCAFPTLSNDISPPSFITFGEQTKNPYTTNHIINISAMSYGSLSKPAIQALSRGAALAGCWLNTGEGGLSKHHLEGGCDIIFQIGTAKYGVRNKSGGLSEAKLKEIAAHRQVKMFELKLAQGAKPGKGGLLPGIKVTREIANIRRIPIGKDSISPNRHPEINSVNDLLNFIQHIREVSQKPTGIKTVIGAYGWLEDMCKEILSRGIDSAPDFITIDGGDGGTGAAPMPLLDNVGLPLKEALPMVIDLLAQHGLRDRIKVIASGKLVTPAEVAWAYCAGADCVNSARGFMFSIGCIQALRCNNNTCPTGITTHKKRLQKGLDPKLKAISIKNFVDKMCEGVNMISHSCGVEQPRALRQYHVRIVQENGQSVPMDDIYPERRKNDYAM